MAKKTHWVIPIANEMGYFPTAKQAHEINMRSAYLYAAHYDGTPPAGPVVKDVYDRTFRQAVDDVMSGKVKPRG